MKENNLNVKVLFSGQHKDLIKKCEHLVYTDIILENVMEKNQSLNKLVSKILVKMDDIFEKYIDVEFVKDWFNEDDIKLEDVYEERDGIGVMSVNEDMSLYIFKNDSFNIST